MEPTLAAGVVDATSADGLVVVTLKIEAILVDDRPAAAAGAHLGIGIAWALTHASNHKSVYSIQ